MIKDCCKIHENLVPHQEKPDLLVNKCKVCGCRHFELTVDPLVLNLRGKPMGEKVILIRKEPE